MTAYGLRSTLLRRAEPTAAVRQFQVGFASLSSGAKPEFEQARGLDSATLAVLSGVGKAG